MWCPSIASIFVQTVFFLSSLWLNTPLCIYFVPFQRRHAVSIPGFPVATLMMHWSHFTGSPLLCLPPLLLCPVVTATINSAMVGSLLCAGICFTRSIMIFNSSYHHNIYTLEMRKLTCREFRVFLHFIPVEDAIRTLISCEKTPNSESVGFLGSFTFSAFLRHSPLPLHAASCREESFSCYFFLGFPVSSLMLISLHFHNISCFNLIYLVLLYSALSTSEAVRIL